MKKRVCNMLMVTVEVLRRMVISMTVGVLSFRLWGRCKWQTRLKVLRSGPQTRLVAEGDFAMKFQYRKSKKSS